MKDPEAKMRAAIRALARKKRASDPRHKARIARERSAKYYEKKKQDRQKEREARARSDPQWVQPGREARERLEAEQRERDIHCEEELRPLEKGEAQAYALGTESRVQANQIRLAVQACMGAIGEGAHDLPLSQWEISPVCDLENGLAERSPLVSRRPWGSAAKWQDQEKSREAKNKELCP